MGDVVGAGFVCVVGDPPTTSPPQPCFVGAAVGDGVEDGVGDGVGAWHKPDAALHL